MTRMSIGKRTIVRSAALRQRLVFHWFGPLLPARAGRAARDLWFTVPPRMAPLPVPAGGRPFQVAAGGHAVRGRVWGPDGGGLVYLVHGWGGRGAQLSALVLPLVDAGYQVVLFDLPAHGDSPPGPSGPRHTHAVEFAKALDAVFCRFGPAEAVVAHSMGAIATYLALRYGWLGTRRLVFIAPMVEARSLLDQFKGALGIGPRVGRSFERAVGEFVGIPVPEFDLRVQARHLPPIDSLVLSDRDDRQAPHEQVVDFAETVGARLVTTQDLGHRKILRDPAVVTQVTEFVAGRHGVDKSA